MGLVLLMALLVPLVMWLLFPSMRKTDNLVHGAENFISEQFARVWDNGAERQALAEALAKEFPLQLTVYNVAGKALLSQGEPCDEHGYINELAVLKEGVRLGSVRVCVSKRWSGSHGHFIVALLVLLMVIWKTSGKMARHISQPLTTLSSVASRLGHGDLEARSGLTDHKVAEVRDLARTMDDMARRVQKQLTDQRELLAAVSHELRSPLTRMKVALELAEAHDQIAPRLLQSLSEEIHVSDKLVGDMLASARLDFHGLECTSLNLAEVVRLAAQRDLLPVELVQLDAQPSIRGDATLLAQALGNLLDNAQRHGKGVTALRVHCTGPWAYVDVEDQGPGFATDALPHVFTSFYRSAEGGVQGLGLGLALVQRIAHAHGGTAHAHNREDGGACVGLRLPLVSSSPAT